MSRKLCGLIRPKYNTYSFTFNKSLAMKVIFNHLQDPAQPDINCESIRETDPYQVNLDNGTWSTKRSNIFQFYTDGNVSISIGIRVYSNKDFVSEASFHSATTDKLGESLSCFCICFCYKWTRIQRHYTSQSCRKIGP